MDLYLLLRDDLVGERLPLLESLRIAQCVQGVVGCAAAGADAGQHHYFRFLTLHEGISQYHCHF